MTITPLAIIDNIQKASRIKTQASAVYIYELLNSETDSLSAVTGEQWYKSDVNALGELISKKISFTDPQEFDNGYMVIVANILFNLKKMYKNPNP